MAGGGRGLPESTLGERFRRFQARYEPTITRLLLLSVFVVALIAQFVKPVGDALQGKVFLGSALLSVVAYVLYSKVNDLDASLRVPSHAQVKSRELGTFVTEAFRDRTVEISFLGYTGETLYNELYHRLEGLLEDPGPTREVVVRFLVPDFRVPMIVPSRVGTDGVPVDDVDFRKRVEIQCREYDQRLSGIARRLTSLGRVTAACEYRFYPGIPRDKICIFNRELVLHGLYDVSARTVGFSPEPDYYDPQGYRTDLNIWSREDTDDAKAAVATWNKHFDALWELAERPPWHRGTLD
ncbi:hypothetical protein [Streptomyces prunicolor]|uniref:ATP/GTP-binding protein n=1 Tax=Streptomyces prunicolor TaxID=67348 RepID=A0ABU4F7A6_9ACTN|nr:hypothetical protein [Streptomyces prunicolor]MDV7215180.1 hypothetical protein [Streptomyces prunicolor]